MERFLVNHTGDSKALSGGQKGVNFPAPPRRAVDADKA